MITLFRETMISSVSWGLDTEEECQIVQNKIDNYLDFLVKELKTKGNEVEVELNAGSTSSYHTDTDEEFLDIRSINDFWEWYN